MLDKEDLNDYDGRVFFYCKNLGKITAKATSIRKPISKLASHLEPGNVVNVRLIQKNAFQVADALKTRSFQKNSDTINALHLIKELSAEGEMDLELWDLLGGESINGEAVLGALGFDREFASCALCGAQGPRHFLLKELDYYCSGCFLRAGRPASFILK